MIGSLRGEVLERTAAGEVLVEVAGIGYRVHVPTRVLGEYRPGLPVFTYVSHYVREEISTLYAFPTRDDRDTFEVLIGSTGVGPKLALAILSSFGPDDLRRTLRDDDTDALTTVPGVGKKTAQRLLLELKSRLAGGEVDLVAIAGTAAGGRAATAPSGAATGTAKAEVRVALANLGYTPDEIRSLMAGVAAADADGADVPAETMLREALRAAAVGR
jgi:holliday junction DNA helicase RuvA